MPLINIAIEFNSFVSYWGRFFVLFLSFGLVVLGNFACAQSDLSNASEDRHINKQKLIGEIEQIDNSDVNKEKSLTSDTGKEAEQNKLGFLRGSAEMGELDAAKEDPDANDKELMIAWDRWRNRFLQAVLGSTSEMLNSDQARSFQINPQTHVMEAIYPVGTVAWFVCEVTKDKQIKRLRILNSSGFVEYDQTVLEAVQALQGCSLLRFPTGSRRTAVLQGGAVERAAQPENQYFRFGDVERYRLPGY